MKYLPPYYKKYLHIDVMYAIIAVHLCEVICTVPSGGTLFAAVEIIKVDIPLLLKLLR